MTPERYKELQCTDAALTPEEIAEGWHFCAEWDYMLVQPSWPEAKVCGGCLKEDKWLTRY